MKKAFGFLAMAILGGVITLGGYKLLLEDPDKGRENNSNSY